MNRFLAIILIIASLGNVSIAQTPKEEQYKCIVRVKPNFHGWSHCNSDETPSLGYADITIDGETKQVKTLGSIAEFSNVAIGGCNFQKSFPYTLSNGQSFEIKCKVSVNHIDKKRTYERTIIPHSLKFVTSTEEKDDNCFLGKDEGYSVSFAVEIDDPVFLIEKDKASKTFVIEKNETLPLTFNTFYENNLQGRKFQYRFSTDEEWKDFKNTDLNDNIRPGKDIEISFEDIFGTDTSDVDYKRSSGKNILISVRKPVNDNDAIYGNTVTARFYHKGPDFQVEEVRRPYCNNSVNIYVKVEPNTGCLNTQNSRYKWVMTPSSNGVEPVEEITFEKVKNENDRYRLHISKPNDITKINSKSGIGEWILQLQLNDENEKPLAIDFAEHKFTIPEPLSQIDVHQKKESLFTLNGTEYHLFSTENPYVVLDIIDDDESKKGRLPYTVYDRDMNYLTTIDAKIEENSTKLNEERVSYEAQYCGADKKTQFINNELVRLYESLDNKDDKKLYTCIYDGVISNDYSNVLSDEKTVVNIIVDNSNSAMKLYYGQNLSSGSASKYYEFIAGHELENNFPNKIETRTNGYVVVENGTLRRKKGNEVIDVWPAYGAPTLRDLHYVAQNYSTQNRYILTYNDNGVYILHLYFENKYDKDVAGSYSDVWTLEQINITDESKKILNALKGGYDAFVYVDGSFSLQKDSDVLIYKDTKIYNYKTLYNPDNARYITKGDKCIYYKSSGKNYVQTDEKMELPDFCSNFFLDKLYINSTYYDNDWQEYKDRLWRQHYLENYGYRVSGNSIKTNTNDILYFRDSDGCLDSVDYRVNVLDNISVTESNKKNPSSGNSKNGKVTLTVRPGGKLIYYYNGKNIGSGIDIPLDNLTWGDNEVIFTDEHGYPKSKHIVHMTPSVTITSNAQTCSDANGSISISAGDVNTNWRCYNKSVYPIKYLELKKLQAGTYVVQGEYGGKWINVGTTEIEDQIFSVQCIAKNDATIVGGNGKIELKADQYHNKVSWNIGNTQKNGNTVTFELPKNKYVVTAQSNGCSISENISIGGPDIHTNCSLYNQNGSVEINVSASFENVIEHDIILYNKDNNEVTRSKEEKLNVKNLDANQSYSLKIAYKTNKGDVNDYAIFSDLHPLYIATSTTDKSDNTRCFGEKGSIAVGIDKNHSLVADVVKYRIGNNDWLVLSKDGAEGKVDSGDCSVMYKTEIIESDTHTTIKNIAQYTDKLSIAPGVEYIPNIEKKNVSCWDRTDGSISLILGENEKEGSVWLSLNKPSNSSTMDRPLSLSGLQAGMHEFYVVEERCPTFAQKHPRTIEKPNEELKVSIPDNGITNPTCAINDGKIVLEASGGWNDYLAYTRKLTAEEYENALDTTDIDKKLRIEGLKFGNHTIYVHDGGGCVVAVEADLKQYDSPQIINTTAVPARCYGSADGEIVVDAVTVDCSIEDKPLSLLIDSRSDTLSLTNPFQTTIEGLSKGNYNLRLIDVNGCQSDILNVPISEPDPLKVEARLLDGGRIRYKGGSEGRMEVKVSGGNAGIDSVFYNNSNVLVSTGVPYIVEGMSAGPISITASDRYNCPSNDTTLTFIEPEEPIMIEAESQAALCHAMTGSVKVTATGGWGDHRIRLVGERESRNSGEQSDTTFESLYAGDYKIEVEDKYGAKATQSVRVDAPEPISHELITSPDHCDGNGSATIKLSGGMPDYTTIFVVGTDTTKIAGSTVNIGNLVGGREYTLATRDANTCESKLTFKMPSNILTAEIKYVYNTNGSATLTAEVKGGIAPYVYKWRNVSGGEELGTSSTQTVTKSGLYRLDIADASGCSYKTMQDVLMAGSIVMRVKSVTRVTNPENNNGTATIICKATQEVNLRLYHLETDTWTTIQNATTTINLEGLQWGHYCVEGELDNGNMQTAMFFIAPYEPMEVTKMDVKHVSAPGRNDASVVIDFVGGIAPYVLNSATYPTGHIELENLAAGKITLSIADSTGNILTKDVEILEPKQPLVVTPSRVDSASCFSYSDGSVLLTATGGWPDYQYAKGDEEYKISAYFGGLNAGERMFKVVDKYGVEDSVLVTISEPDMLRASVAAIDSVECHGDNNGAVHFTVTGGTAPYRTIYEKETLDGTDVENLLSGSYVMKFTDSHQCKSPDTISIYIPEPDLLELANDYVTHTTCELDNGKIAIEVKGGSLPYRYVWKENGATYGGAKTVNMVRSEAENLKQNGLYHIDITDSHRCHTEYEKVIEHSDNPRVMGVATTDVLCYGSSDGIAEVDSSQVKWGCPKANYSLTWPQGQMGVMSVNTLPAGRHTVRITDDNNCTTTREFTVGTPEPVKNHLASVRDALCYSYSDGRIETHTTGGVGDYTYVWNTGETTSYADSLKAGMYKVIVTDSHECKDSAIYEVTEPEELKVNLGDDVLICPGNIHVFDAGEYATYSWRNAASGEEIETERYLATGDEGDYAIKVTDEIGCIARDTVNLRIGENALQANFLMASDAAVNDTIVLIELSNMPVDSVRWQYDKLMTVDVEEAEEYMFPLMAESTGRYYITMWAYSGGCESFEQKFIDIYEAVVDTSDFKIGYDPLIKQAKVSPNPNDGEFDLIIVLRETSDIDVTVYDVNNGRQVEHVVLKDSDKYNTRFNIRQWGSGIFVLSIVSGTERRAIKVLCVR